MFIPKTFIKPETFNYWGYDSSSRTFVWRRFEIAEHIIDWNPDKLNFTNYFDYCKRYLEPSLLELKI